MDFPFSSGGSFSPASSIGTADFFDLNLTTWNGNDFNQMQDSTGALGGYYSLDYGNPFNTATGSGTIHPSGGDDRTLALPPLNETAPFDASTSCHVRTQPNDEVLSEAFFPLPETLFSNEVLNDAAPEQLWSPPLILPTFWTEPREDPTKQDYLGSPSSSRDTQSLLSTPSQPSPDQYQMNDMVVERQGDTFQETEGEVREDIVVGDGVSSPDAESSGSLRAALRTLGLPEPLPSHLFAAESDLYPKIPYSQNTLPSSKWSEIPRGRFKLGLESAKRLNGRVPVLQKGDTLKVYVTSYPSKEVEKLSTYGCMILQKCLATDPENERQWKIDSLVHAGDVELNAERRARAHPIGSHSTMPFEATPFFPQYTGNSEKRKRKVARFHELVLWDGFDRHNYLFRLSQHVLCADKTSLVASDYSPLWTYAKRTINVAAAKKRKLDPEAVDRIDHPVDPGTTLGAIEMKSLNRAFESVRLPVASLQFAASNGRVAEAEDALRRGADINSRDWNVFTPLMLASVAGDVGMMKVLVQAGARFDVEDKSGNPLLHLAIRSLVHEASETKWDALQYLLGEAPDILSKSRDKTGQSPLHLVVLEGNDNLPLVALLLSCGGESFNCSDQHDDNGRTPLMLACQNGSWRSAKFLLDYNSRTVLAKDAHMLTVLHYVSTTKIAELVWNSSLAKSQSIDTLSIHGTTALCQAIENGFLGVASYLLEQGASRDHFIGLRFNHSPLVAACKRPYDTANIAFIERLIKAPPHPDPENCSESWHGALYVACQSKNFKASEILLAERNRLLMLNPEWHPLLLLRGDVLLSACRSYNLRQIHALNAGQLVDLVRSLLDAGADVLYENKRGFTAIRRAAQSADQTSRQSMFNRARQDEQWSLVEHEQWSLVELLISRGALQGIPARRARTGGLDDLLRWMPLSTRRRLIRADAGLPAWFTGNVEEEQDVMEEEHVEQERDASSIGTDDEL